MFAAFLSPDMTYSCGIFGPEEGGLNGDLIDVSERKVAPTPGVDELEGSQIRKLKTIVEKAKITKGDRVLEIGSGWGSFAIEVRFFLQALRVSRQLNRGGAGGPNDGLYSRYTHPFRRAETSCRGAHTRRRATRLYHCPLARLPFATTLVRSRFRPRRFD